MAVSLPPAPSLPSLLMTTTRRTEEAAEAAVADRPLRHVVRRPASQLMLLLLLNPPQPSPWEVPGRRRFPGPPSRPRRFLGHEEIAESVRAAGRIHSKFPFVQCRTPPVPP